MIIQKYMKAVRPGLKNQGEKSNIYHILNHTYQPLHRLEDPQIR